MGRRWFFFFCFQSHRNAVSRNCRLSNFANDRRHQRSRPETAVATLPPLLQHQPREIAHRNDVHRDTRRKREAENPRLDRFKILVKCFEVKLCIYNVIIEKLNFSSPIGSTPDAIESLKRLIFSHTKTLLQTTRNMWQRKLTSASVMNWNEAAIVNQHVPTRTASWMMLRFNCCQK